MDFRRVEQRHSGVGGLHEHADLGAALDDGVGTILAQPVDDLEEALT